MEQNINELQEKDFIYGLAKITGIPEQKLMEYASENNILNVLEHPMTIATEKVQMEKIIALNEFLVSYRVLKLTEHNRQITLTSVTVAGEYFLSRLSGIKDREQLIAVFLDGANNIIETKVIAEGKINETIFDPKVIIKTALYCDCTSIILAHNHPTGGTTPSATDKRVTAVMVSILEPYSIALLDHIIVGGINYCSMAQDNNMQKPSPKYLRYDPIYYGEKPPQKTQAKMLIASEPGIEETGGYIKNKKRNADKDFCR